MPKKELLNSEKWYLANWRLSKVKFNTQPNQWVSEVRLKTITCSNSWISPGASFSQSLLKKLHALHNGANYAKLKLESQINWRSRFLLVHNVQWKLLNNAAADYIFSKQIYKLSEVRAVPHGVFYCSFKITNADARLLQLNCRLGAAAPWKQCNNVLREIISRRRRVFI